MPKKCKFLAQNWSVNISAFSNRKLHLPFVIFTIKEIFHTLNVHMILINDSEKMWVACFTQQWLEIGHWGTISKSRH